MPRKLVAVRCCRPQRRRIDFFDEQSIERPREIGGEPQILRGSSRTDQSCKLQQPLGRVDRRGHGIVFDSIERPADTLIDLGIADRDQPRQKQALTARADEGIGHRAHRAIVGQQDAAAREDKRVPAEAGDQAGGKRVGERAARRDGEDTDPPRVRHSRAPFPSA